MSFKSMAILMLAWLTVTGPAWSQRRHSNAQRSSAPAVVLTPEEETAQAQSEALHRRMEEMLPSTRRTVFIDSLVCDKDRFLESLRLTADAGRFVHSHTLFNQRDAESLPPLGSAAFINPLGNRVLFSAADTTGCMRLHDAYRIDGGWSHPTLLAGLEGVSNQDFPFLLSDGVTLYFAATGEESIGGYDIFVSRYSSADHAFAPAENIGFPFNSEANDYMLAIDDATGIGILVTDRRQPDDKVCLYWFIHDSTYATYDLDPDDEEERATLEGYARLLSVAATASDTEMVSTARQRWHSALAAQKMDSDSEHLRFVVNDQRVITHISQFHSSEAARLASKWLQESQLLQQLQAEQTALRREYAQSASRRTAQRLLNLETQIPQLRQSIYTMAQQCRAAELAGSNTRP